MRNRRPLGRGRLALLGVGIAALVAVAVASTASSSTKKSVDIVAQAKATIAKYYKATDGIGKPTSTPKPKKNQSIWVISCDQTLTGCSLPAASIKKAAAVIGWKVTIFDGHSNPAEYANGVSQAVAAHANAIVLDSTDCNFAKAPLQQAKAAGILIYGYDTIDCSDPGEGGGPHLLTYTGLPKGYKTYAQFIRDWGKLKADYVIAKTNGKAHVITWSEKDILSINYEGQAMKAEFDKCSTCTQVANVDFTLADFANNGVFQKFQTALTQHPDANATATLYDVTILAAVSPVLKTAVRTADFVVAGGEGYPPNLQLMRDGGGQNSAFAIDIIDVGYPTVDNLIRLLDHQKPVDEAVGITLIDPQHNLSKVPASNVFNGFFPYASYYTKLWKKALKGK
ncbi:MAG TPA: substrate-binding domain-containing protein [Gaiellaceae bacterium]